MHRAIVVLILQFLLLVYTTCAASADPPEVRVALIGHLRDHPFETHEYLVDLQVLAKCLGQAPGVSATVHKGWPDDPQALTGTDVLVLHVASGGNFLFDAPHRDRARQLLDDGAGLVAIHWSTGAEGDATGELYQQYLGAWFSTKFARLAHVELPLIQREPEHPICRGWKPYPLFDEYYLDLRFDPRSQSIVEVEEGGKRHPVLWTFERTQPRPARTVGCVLGHYHKNFGNQDFRRMLVNATLWTAGRDVPNDGAAVAIDDRDLELPPDLPEHRKP